MFGITSSIGYLLLAIYLILTGISTIVGSLGIPAVVMGLIALIAGVFILLGR